MEQISYKDAKEYLIDCAQINQRTLPDEKEINDYINYMNSME